MQPRKIVLLVFGFLILSAMAALLAMGFARTASDMIQLRRAAAWPTATATVTVARIDHGCANGKVKGHAFDVQYEYAYDGRRFTGRGLALGQSTCESEQTATTLAQAYPVGAQVPVHVDPTEPSVSTIQAGGPTWGDWGALAALATGLAFMLFGLSRVFVEWKKLQGEQT